jgi:hypothetical protein
MLIEAVSATEPSVGLSQATERSIPIGHLHTCHCENLKYHQGGGIWVGRMSNVRPKPEKEIDLVREMKMKI